MSEDAGDEQGEQEAEEGAEAGVRAVVLPKDVVKDLTTAFAASDTRWAESACWLLSAADGDQRKHEFLECVI